MLLSFAHVTLVIDGLKSFVNGVTAFVAMSKRNNSFSIMLGMTLAGSWHPILLNASGVPVTNSCFPSGEKWNEPRKPSPLMIVSAFRVVRSRMVTSTTSVGRRDSRE